MPTYKEVRDTLKSGDLVFYSSHNSLGDKLIKWWSESKYSHVGMVWAVAGRVFLLEASARGGVRMVPMSSRLPDLIIPMDLTWNEAAERHAMEHIMEPYSIIDAVRAGFRENYNQKGWICTEYVASITKECGYIFPKNAKVPEDFINILRNENRLFLFID
jgi:hypothetical protein